VVESEVAKIRKALTASLELQYGEQIADLKHKSENSEKLVTQLQDEISDLKGLAARHRWALEQREKLRAELQSLGDELDEAKRENGDLSQQLTNRDEVVAQMRTEHFHLESELRRQASTFAEEKRAYDEKLRAIRLDMRQQQDQFKEHLRSYEDKFAEYRAKTTSELQIQHILNTRRSEALSAMEEELQRHIKARTKPTPRIGEGDDTETTSTFESYPLEKSTPRRYRVDEMGMDTSWRDYQISDLNLAPPVRKQLHAPKFRVERAQKWLGPHAPKASDHLLPVPSNQDALRQCSGASVLAPPTQR
jgi:predicted  nucleic acid-binding Zn-ribbon protein